MGDELACVGMSDEQLLTRMKALAAGERRVLTVLLLHIAEIDRRRLYAREGCRTLWEYCTRELGYSESAALRRIVAARLLRRFPAIVRMIDEGKLHLSALVALSPHLTPENHEELLVSAQGKSKRELEFMAAALSPRQDVRDSERIEPLSGERALIRFSAGRQFLELLERAREVLRHRYPGGGLEELLAESLESLLERRDPMRIFQRRRARRRKAVRACASAVTGRRIPSLLREEVFLRDGGRCAFVGGNGRRCDARGGLEVDHIIPWAMGGRSDDLANLRLLCREHNQSEARRIFGDGFIDARLGHEGP